jgi:hypothetical protein
MKKIKKALNRRNLIAIGVALAIILLVSLLIAFNTFTRGEDENGNGSNQIDLGVLLV